MVRQMCKCPGCEFLQLLYTDIMRDTEVKDVFLIISVTFVKKLTQREKFL